MHLLVLSAFRQALKAAEEAGVEASQCTFWCSVLSDSQDRVHSVDCSGVSMHLLVLSAFRPEKIEGDHLIVRVSMHLLVLSAFRRAARSICLGVS